MEARTISIAKEFSRFPAGRFTSDGPYPGEKFREEILLPALRTTHRITIQLDGTLGYGSSFLEEAFGGLVRLHGFSAQDLRSRLSLESTDSSLREEIWSYIGKAKPKGGSQ